MGSLTPFRIPFGVSLGFPLADPGSPDQVLLVHPVTEPGARGVHVYLPGEGEVSAEFWGGFGGFLRVFFGVWDPPEP